VRLAWVSPLPPTASGIADYSFELLPLVAELADVDAIAERPGRFRRPLRPRGVRVLDPAALRRRRSYGAVLYHLGNNPYHQFVYEAAVDRPGIAVFHDFTLHHLISYMTVEQRNYSRYFALLQEEYGDVGTRLAALRLNGVQTDYEKFLFPLNAHVARRAQAIVVHSTDAMERIQEIAPGIPITVIPHHAGAPPADVAGVTREAARRSLGLPPEGEAFLVGHFGFITRPKQPAAVIGGFAQLAARRPDATLFLVGADQTGGRLARLIERHGVEDRIRMTGFVDLARFYLYLKAVDVVVNLRYPSAGESSGTVARSLAEGRATIVNNLGSFAQIPGDVVLKVEVDGDQADQVGNYLERLAADPDLLASYEERSRRYAQTALDPRRCAGLYVEAARQVIEAGLQPVGTAPSSASSP
jgi:glycosyltransferase involved in cell wall biosynthesis